MTMDYSPWDLAVFESSGISETREVTPTKIGVHSFQVNSYLHDALSQFYLILFADLHKL